MSFIGYSSTDRKGHKDYYVFGNTETKSCSSDLIPFEKEIFAQKKKSAEQEPEIKFLRHEKNKAQTGYNSALSNMAYRIGQIGEVILPNESSLIERIIFRDSTETIPVGEIELKIEGGYFYTRAFKYGNKDSVSKKYGIKEGANLLGVLENAHNKIMSRLRDLEVKKRETATQNSLKEYKEAEKNRALLKEVTKTFDEAEMNKTASELIRDAG